MRQQTQTSSRTSFDLHADSSANANLGSHPSTPTRKRFRAPAALVEPASTSTSVVPSIIDCPATPSSALSALRLSSPTKSRPSTPAHRTRAAAAPVELTLDSSRTFDSHLNDQRLAEQGEQDIGELGQSKLGPMTLNQEDSAIIGSVDKTSTSAIPPGGDEALVEENSADVSDVASTAMGGRALRGDKPLVEDIGAGMGVVDGTATGAPTPSGDKALNEDVGAGAESALASAQGSIQVQRAEPPRAFFTPQDGPRYVPGTSFNWFAERSTVFPSSSSSPGSRKPVRETPAFSFAPATSPPAASSHIADGAWISAFPPYTQTATFAAAATVPLPSPPTRLASASLDPPPMDASPKDLDTDLTVPPQLDRLTNAAVVAPVAERKGVVAAAASAVGRIALWALGAAGRVVGASTARDGGARA